MRAPGTFPRDLPPVWLLGCVLAMLALHVLWPGARLVSWPWTLAGAAIALAGLALMIWGAGLFRRRGTGVRPFTPVTTLVVEGPYRFTRNPMYLGMATMVVGLALGLGTATPWLLLPVLTLVLDRRFIRREEQFLRERLGAAYADYCRRVRRWL